jgi:uncharacterized protein
VTVTLLRDPPRLRFAVRVQPRASRNRIAGAHGDALKVQITAPPLEGAANAALLAFLAAELGVAKAAVRLVAGEHARAKIVEVECAQPEPLRARLEGMASVDKTRAAD